MTEIHPDVLAAIQAELDQRHPKPQSLADFVLQFEENLAELKRTALHPTEMTFENL